MKAKNLATVLFAIGYCFNAHALLQVTNLPTDMTIQTWAGATGDLEATASFCIVSTNPNNVNNQRRYNVAGYSIVPASVGGEFPIQNQTTSNTIEILYTFVHPAGTYPLQDYTTTGYVTPNVIGATSCADPNSQVQIILTLPEAQLLLAEAGVYQGTLGFDVFQAGNGGQYSGVLQFNMNIPQLTQITRLEDVVIPVATFQEVEDFCVFRNGQGGLYSIRASGQNNTSDGLGGTEFNLRQTTDISYTVEFGQNGVFAPPVQPNEKVTGMDVGLDGIRRNCGGFDNAQIRLTASETEALQSPGGTYTDVLTITVEEE